MTVIVMMQSCSDTLPATEVILVVDSDLKLEDELDELEVRVVRPNELGNDIPPSHPFSLSKEPSGTQYTLPLSLSLVPNGNPNGRFRLILTGLLRKTRIVEQQVLASFREGRSLELRVFLSRKCADALCYKDGLRVDASCQPETGSCGPVADAGELPEWPGAVSPAMPEEPECTSGWQLVDGACRDVDECEQSPTICQPERCVNSEGSYSCVACPLGSEVDAIGECVDVNECERQLDDCHEDAECRNSSPAFECICRDGFVGTGRGLTGCTAIEPPDCAVQDSSPETAVSFSNDVRPILESCTCHDPKSEDPFALWQSGLSLPDYESLRQGGENTGMNIIVAFNPCESLLLKKLSPLPGFGERMPAERRPLTSAEITIISDWIIEGALEN